MCRGIVGTLILACAANAGQLPVLTTTLAVHSLSSDEADRHYPVHVRGVVTSYEPRWYALYISDSSGGIYIDTHSQPVPLHAGQVIDVDGVSGKGGFAPTILLSHYKVLGEGPMPPAQRVGFDRLSTGAAASQYVEVEGIVRSATVRKERLSLRLAVGAGSIEVSTPEFKGSSFDYLVDSEVRVRGVPGQNFNEKRQMTGSKLSINSLNDLEIVRAAPADVWSVALRPVVRLAVYSATGLLGHRVRVRGAVTLNWPGKMLVVRDDSQGVVVKTDQSTALRVGDLADVVGFPGSVGYSPTLEGALVRPVTGHAEVPARRVSQKEAASGTLDSELVTIEGALVQVNTRNDEYSLVVSADGAMFDAILPTGQGSPELSRIPVGSKIRLTGVCLVELDANRNPKDFRILLRSARDVIVTQAPSWWTLRTSLYALSFAVAVGVLILAWVAVLRRRVAQQTLLIRSQLQDAEMLKEAAAQSEARFQAFMDHSPLVGFIKDEAGRMIYLNRRFTQVFGRESKECLGRDDFELWPQDIAAEIRSNDLEVLRTGRSGEFLETTPLPDSGSITWLALKFAFRQGASTFIGGMAIDITERERAKEALRISEERFHSLFSHATTGIAIADCEGAVIRVNPAFCRIMTTCEEDCLGSTISQLLGTDVDTAAEGTAFESCLIRGETSLWTENSLFAVPDSAGGVLNIVLMVEDITQRKCAEAQLGFEARHDPLTGLTNRRAHETYFKEQIEEAGRKRGKLCLLYVDLDDFKIINDTMGHDAGDAVLRETAMRLSSLAADRSGLSRIGGDEFVLVREVEDRNEAMALSSRLRLAMEKPFHIKGQYIKLRASAGLSVFPEDGTDEETLCRRADQAMYAAKQSEKSRRNTHPQHALKELSSSVAPR